MYFAQFTVSIVRAIGGGLIKKAFQIEDVKTTSGKLEGFQLSADGHRYFSAEATIQGDKVVVSSDAVKSPKHVRYASLFSPISLIS